MKPNKEGADWLVIKAHLNARIKELQESMLSLLPAEEYHYLRGSIVMAKGLIEWVEGKTPVSKTKEEDYGYSGGEDGNYA